ncbi:MAG: ECF transporter S component [Alistipes sp.]|nr:ECF transporter S component [Alistipes sp.]
MQVASVKLYSLNYNEAKSYIAVALFVVGNVLFPQLCHLMPQGGMVWLPIYFFTLVGAYKYGWKVGLMTAILSPLCNNLLFGMPATALLVPILAKSTILALAAGFVASRHGKVSLLALAAVVATYQVVGGAFEWAWTGSFAAAMQDFKLGIPGMLTQIVGGYLFIKYILKR